MAEAIRPTFETWAAQYGKSERSIVKFNRARAAYDMAAKKNEHPTTQEVGKAYSLLERCIRFALADSRMDETETEANWNSPARVRKQELLMERCKKLQKELDEYDCCLYRPWSCYEVYDKGPGYGEKGALLGNNRYLYFY